MKWQNDADAFYQPKPGTDLAWLSAVTKYILLITTYMINHL